MNMLVCCLWPSLGDVSSKLSNPIFVPNYGRLGKAFNLAFNKVCICYDKRVPPPNNMVLNVGVGLKVTPFRFGTFFGTWSRCNSFDDFVRDYPTTKKCKRNLNLKIWRWNLQSKLKTTRKALHKPNHMMKLLKLNLKLRW